MMIKGRPAEKQFYSQFFGDDRYRNIDSLSRKTNVSGLQLISSRLENAFWHGRGKIWLTNARLFIGDFYGDKLS